MTQCTLPHLQSIDHLFSPHSGNASEEMPLRSWNIELHLVGPHGEELPATCFEKVVYSLHETFNDRKIQSKAAPILASGGSLADEACVYSLQASAIPH